MKAKQLFIISLAILGFCSTLTFAQETDQETKTYRHSLGIGAGFTTGYGLSYRYFPTKLGLQLNFAPYKTKETAQYSAGLTFIYPIIPGQVASLYVYQGNHYFYNSHIIYYMNETMKEESFEPTGFRKRIEESYFNNGLGFGMELAFAKRMGFNLMAGYAFYDNFRQINVTGETALYFKF